MSNPTLLLVDNGSSRPESALNLRRLARRLSQVSGREIHPVSLQHANKIDPKELDGVVADTFHPFMARRLSRGERRFLVLPLFFGPSRALSSFIPDQVSRLQTEFGAFELIQAQVLCPLPEGEPHLARILHEQLPATAMTPRRVILVDHGSPMPDVTAVRHYLAHQLRDLLGPDDQLAEAVMERRKGGDYDFNGALLLQVLGRMAEEDDRTPIALSLLFMSPGRHAGSGGDIETICRQVRSQYPQLTIETSGLVGEHDGLITILQQRLNSAL